MQKDIEYVKVFYKVMYDGKCIEYVSYENSRVFDKKEIYNIFYDVIKEKESFMGFVDSKGDIIQFYVNGQNDIILDIPDAQKNGSYIKNINNETMYKIINVLKKPYLNYIKQLNLEFISW